MPFRIVLLAVMCVFVPSASRQASAQHFGKNKVEYVDFDFRVFETDHFEVYYYPAEERAARMVARLAERWYARLSRVLEHTLGGWSTKPESLACLEALAGGSATAGG